jgi:hypothetical protein
LIDAVPEIEERLRPILKAELLAEMARETAGPGAKTN